MMSNQFEMMDEDHCIYVKKSNDKFVILTPYVDDILIVGNHVEYLLIIKELLSFNFKMKNMGESSYILGVKIHLNHTKILLILSQEQYFQRVLERFRMENCNPTYTPMAKGEKLSNKLCPKTPKQKERMETVLYAIVVGSLMYAILCTRTNIFYVVGVVSK